MKLGLAMQHRPFSSGEGISGKRFEEAPRSSEFPIAIKLSESAWKRYKADVLIMMLIKDLKHPSLRLRTK